MENSLDIKKVHEFMVLVGKLKHMKRRGWELKQVRDPESIAGHMYRMAMLSFLVDSKELDKFKVMQMALVHDLAECIVGDITPHCGVPVHEKHRLEEEAMEDICKPLGEKGNEMLEIFKEYEKRETPEAKFVKDLDKVDLLMQALEYEERDKCPGRHQEFFDNIGGIEDPFVQKIADEINSQRKILINNTHSISNDRTKL